MVVVVVRRDEAGGSVSQSAARRLGSHVNCCG